MVAIAKVSSPILKKWVINNNKLMLIIIGIIAQKFFLS